MPRWFDTHVHLERYTSAEQARLVREASAAGVDAMLAVSTSCASSGRTAALALPVRKAVGIHPSRAADGVCPGIRHLAAEPGVVAIGETGFDATGPDFEHQGAAFVEQLSIARDLDLAVVLHIDGPGAFHKLLRTGDALDGLRVIRHYFTGDAVQATWHADRGHYLSFGRPLMRDSALQDIAATYPPELLLIETDSYPLPGRTTEPNHLVEVGEALARIRGWSNDECADRLWKNSHEALGLAPA
jgi:TatD DNase family protein